MFIKQWLVMSLSNDRRNGYMALMIYTAIGLTLGIMMRQYPYRYADVLTGFILSGALVLWVGWIVLLLSLATSKWCLSEAITGWVELYRQWEAHSGRKVVIATIMFFVVVFALAAIGVCLIQNP